ncbi:MAG: rhodanese-like domain-containing protein [Acidimicrobiia bacterium]|nr:rhodanese-like domain-containing protein [Acidimicrobiia bacterium]
MTIDAIDLQTTWELLRDDADSVLLDVRTQAEWAFVGVPDLRSLGKEPLFIEWTQYPGGDWNPDFHATATKRLDPTCATLVICRSGARSQAAAEALEQIGFVAAHNVVAGFEGHLDADGHRTGGWKGSGLPWVQH